MNQNLAHIVTFSIGWILFVAAQVHNSVRSTANGLSGWAGYKEWLRLQAVNLMTRAFFSAIFFATLIQWSTEKLAAVGFTVHAETVAGVAGYAANGFLYQVFGLIPWLRVEVQDLAPPANSQVMPVPIPPTPPTSGTTP